MRLDKTYSSVPSFLLLRYFFSSNLYRFILNKKLHNSDNFKKHGLLKIGIELLLNSDVNLRKFSIFSLYIIFSQMSLLSFQGSLKVFLRIPYTFIFLPLFYKYIHKCISIGVSLVNTERKRFNTQMPSNSCIKLLYKQVLIPSI